MTSRANSVLRQPLLALALAFMGSGCPSGAQQSAFRAQVGDNTVNCCCNLHVTTSPGHVGGRINVPNLVQTCLPPELNLPVALSTSDPNAPGLADMGEDEFARRVNEYCTQTIGKVVYHMARLTSQNFCDYKNGNAAFGDNDNSSGPDGSEVYDYAVHCFAQPTNAECGSRAAMVPDGGVDLGGTNLPGFATFSDNTTGGCNTPCGAVACSSYNPDNCDPAKVLRGVDIHPEFCKCNQIIDPAFDCTGDPPTVDVPTATFCQPGPGRADPPVLTSSVVTRTYSSAIPIQIDSTQSMFQVSISQLGDNVTRTTPVHGTVTLYGRPCPGAECDMLMDFAIFPEPFLDSNHFHFSVAPDVYLSNLSIVGGMGSVRVHIFADGHGVIPQNQLAMDSDGDSRLDGAASHDQNHFTILTSNPDDLLFSVDWARGGLFSLPGTPSSVGNSTAGGTGTLTLVGRVTNLPPNVVAGPSVQQECTSPAGATVTLDASASRDPENDPLVFSWWQGVALGPTPLANGGQPAVTVTAPLGLTQYTVQATDWRSVGVDAVDVRVVDSNPPQIACPADQTIECGAGLLDFALNVHDTCDPSPKVACAIPAGTHVGVGSFTNVCVAADAHSNESFCTFRVDVKNTTPPVVTLKNQGIVHARPLGRRNTVTVSIDDCIASVVSKCEGPLVPAAVGKVLSVEKDGLHETECRAGEIAISSNTSVTIVPDDDAQYLIIWTVADSSGNKTAAQCTVIVSDHDDHDCSYHNLHPSRCDCCVSASPGACGSCPAPGTCAGTHNHGEHNGRH